MPLFLENYVAEEGGKDPMENQNIHFDDIDFGIFLTEGENLFSQYEAAPFQSVVTLS